jgi:6-phosphofructokinase
MKRIGVVTTGGDAPGMNVCMTRSIFIKLLGLRYFYTEKETFDVHNSIG